MIRTDEITKYKDALQESFHSYPLVKLPFVKFHSARSNMNSTAPLHFSPSAPRYMIEARASLYQRIREFFAKQQFLEVETPLLSSDTVVDRHIDPIFVPLSLAPSPSSQPLLSAHRSGCWLQTSPEFAMKRMLAAGLMSIFQICKAFRAEEAGPRHNPEFTMLEWYRVGDSYQEGMSFLAEFSRAVIDVNRPAQRLSYRQAFQQLAQIDPFSDSVERISDCAKKLGYNADWPRTEATRDEWLNLLMAEVVEPGLEPTTPTIIFDWPASQSALAIIRQDEFPVAERFELFYRGFELANGYHELLDADELRRRNRENNRTRTQNGKQTLPTESRLLAAMEHGLPACVGVALGIDRLLMAQYELDSIDQVISFPASIA